MSTRCRIAFEKDNGEVVSSYCHHDGYIEGVGQLLKKHYNTPELAEQVASLGDFSSLRETLEETKKTCYNESNHPFRVDKDWGELEAKIGKCGEEFTYLYTTDYSGVYGWQVAETPYFKEY